ncbi:hypothetical protein HID58_076032 [Brassica napus]|uniref:Uncharacterized protein n=1 Tax=Brassica napus TaxID=3708 RepID=A0ABQ7YPM3_BRANA|nr:hypothetical protein HID58_076032 [Brassica napus]
MIFFIILSFVYYWFKDPFQKQKAKRVNTDRRQGHNLVGSLSEPETTAYVILIFSAPKTQWAQVLRSLPFSAETDDGIFLEKIELLLLGRLASRWTQLIEGVVLLLPQRSKSLKQNEIPLSSKVTTVEEILEYFTEMLENLFHTSGNCLLPLPQLQFHHGKFSTV